MAYYLLTSPQTIADQNLVYILGAAMDVVRPQFPTIPPLIYHKTLTKANRTASLARIPHNFLPGSRPLLTLPPLPRAFRPHSHEP